MITNLVPTKTRQPAAGAKRTKRTKRSAQRSAKRQLQQAQKEGRAYRSAKHRTVLHSVRLMMMTTPLVRAMTRQLEARRTDAGDDAGDDAEGRTGVVLTPR